jgi:hypothetical protein
MRWLAMVRREEPVMPEYESERSLTMWLVTQERVMRLWIEEAADNLDADLAEQLEIHRQWLSRRIDELSRRRVA